VILGLPSRVTGVALPEPLIKCDTSTIGDVASGAVCKPVIANTKLSLYGSSLNSDMPFISAFGSCSSVFNLILYQVQYENQHQDDSHYS